MESKGAHEHFFIQHPRRPEMISCRDCGWSVTKTNLHIKKGMHPNSMLLTPAQREQIKPLLKEELPKNGDASDYIDDFVHSKNKMFKGDSKKKRIKRALGAFYKQKNESIMSVGSGAITGITDPTTNYAFQVQKKKFKKLAEPAIARRKKPVGEEFEAGLGNTQMNPGTKKGLVKLSTIKDRGIKVKNKKQAADPPAITSVNADTGPAMGGE